MITGPSGIGKSTIVKLVALQLQKTKDYHILPVMCPKDIVKYFDPNIKQIYIIDDICGTFSVDQSMINSWERIKCQILKYCKNNKDFRVLGTCRLEISISGPFRKLQEKYAITECNLLEKKFLYSKEEKLKIAACHIDEETIKQLDDKILNTYNMFPLLCMMFAASESKPGVRFFEYPLQAIEEQLDQMNEQNECCCIGLALIVVYNNKLYKHLLQNGDDKKFEDVFNKVFEELELRSKPSKRSVLSYLKALEGIYTKEIESTITVIHDKIFDIFALYFGKKIPKTILTHGSGTFIAERFLFESVKDDLKIVLPSELEHSYFNRMVEEIENNRFYNVFENVQVCNELYQGKFISFLSKHQSIVQKLLYNKWPLYLSAVNGYKLLVEFILNEKRTSGMCNKLEKDGNHQDMLKNKPESDMYACSIDTDNDESTPIFYDTDDDKRTTAVDAYRIKFEYSLMLAACEGGDINIVECLIEYGYNIDHSDTNLPTLLFSACKYGNKDVVDFLLKRNCKVDAINENDQTALHAACKNGNIDIVNSLLKCNSTCNMNLHDFVGRTPLYYACRKGHTDIVQILLDNNCDIHGAIIGACEGGYKDIVQILIKHNVNINQHGGYLNKTPIYYACINGHTDIVQILLDNNCDIHGAIHEACEGGYKDIVQILIKHNADIDHRRRQLDKDKTPIYYACRNGHTDIVQILLDNNCDIHGAIHGACEGGYKDIVEILIKHNADINQRDDQRYKTPIYYACHNGHTDIVQILLDNNCDIHGAIHEACKGGYKDIVEILIKHNVDINQCGGELDDTPIYCADVDKKTPLFIACKEGCIDIVRLLIESKCEIFNHSLNGQTVLHAVCSGDYRNYLNYIRNRNYLEFETFTEGHKDILTLLIDKQCDVNISDNNSQTPLHIACYKGNVALVEILLRNKCVVDQCDNLNKTPFFLACEEGHIDVVKSLMHINCNIDIRDKIGRSALHAVCTTDYFLDYCSDRFDIAELLINKKCGVYDLDDAGQSTLHGACKHDNPRIVKLLLQNKFDVDQRDKMGETPIFNACRVYRTDILNLDTLKLLIEWNCDVNVLNINGLNALNIAVNSEWFSKRYIYMEIHLKEVVKLLVDSGCSVNICDADGQTPLHRACSKGYVDEAELFLKRNSNINQCDNLMKTPLILAVEGEHTEVVTMLVKNKCDIDISDKDGRTALDIAEENRVVDIKNILLNVMKKKMMGAKKAKYFL